MALFNFKKKKEKVFVSPMDGNIMNLDSVPDQVFSERLMGDGFAIELKEGTVVAPISGEITVAFPTKHAYGIKSNDGVELLIHLGIDTVELNGKGFNPCVEVGSIVKQGDTLVTVDLEYIKSQDKSLISPILFVSGEKIELLKINQNVEKLESNLFKFI